MNINDAADICHESQKLKPRPVDEWHVGELRDAEDLAAAGGDPDIERAMVQGFGLTLRELEAAACVLRDFMRGKANVYAARAYVEKVKALVPELEQGLRGIGA